MANNQQEPYIVYIPHIINLDFLLAQYPLSIYVPNAKDYIHYLLSLVQVDYINIENRPFTILYSKNLQTIVDNYSVLFRWLINRNIIEIDPYIKKVKKQGYRFTESYCVYLKPVILGKRGFVAKLNRLNANISNQLNASDVTGYSYEPRWIRSDEVANMLNLKPRKMKQGLIRHAVVSTDIEGNLEPHPTRFFHYKQTVNRRGYIGNPLMINEDKLNIIRNLVIAFPLDFPEKDSPRRSRIQIS